MTRRTMAMAALAIWTTAASADTASARTTQAAAADPQAAKMADAVKAAELKRFEATTRNDLDALAGFLADDLVYVHSSTAVDNKEKYLETLRTGKTRYHTIEPSDVSVRVYGTTAVITGLAKLSLTTNGEERAFSLRYTDVWVQRGGKWQMVSWQSTRLP